VGYLKALGAPRTFGSKTMRPRPARAPSQRTSQAQIIAVAVPEAYQAAFRIPQEKSAPKPLFPFRQRLRRNGDRDR
jgi:hypothetical protein